MTRRRWIGVAITFFLLLFSQAAWAQTTGSIRGRTVDADGQPLPGVTIAITGEVIGSAQRTAVTSPSGGFNFSAMPIGTYTVAADLAGFQKQAAENVRVAIGKVASVDFTMPEAFSEEITVIAETPIIDVSSASFNTRFESEQIIDLPTRGNFYDMIAQTPGMTQNSEGSSSIVAFGADVTMSQWNIDGVNRTLPEGGYLAWSMNDEMVAEIQVLGTGASAEYGSMLGTAFNVVTKSGTNEFHGSAAFDYWNPNWVDENAVRYDAPEGAQTYRLDTNNNLSVTLGGPIVRDKVWFFVGAEWGEFKAFWPNQVEIPESKADTWTNYDGKITSQPAQNHRLTLTFNDHTGLNPSLGSVYDELSTWQESWWNDNMMALDYSAILGQNTVLEARGGLWRGDEEWRPQHPSDEPYWRDWTVWPVEDFGGTYWNWVWERHSDTAEVKLTQHADNFIAGDHEFRFGVQYNRGGGSTKPYNVLYYYLYDYYGPDYVYEYLYTGLPYYYGGESKSWAAFFTDSWNLSSQVTLEIGVRYDTHDGWVNDFPRLDVDSNPTGETIPGAEYINGWSNVDPRLGFAWNIGGEGKNVLRASAGLFHAGLVSGDWYSPPPDSPEWAYYWREPDCPNCEWNFMRSVPPPPRAFLVPGTQNAETLEFTLGFEHQLTATSAIGISAAYKKTTNLLGWYIDDDGEFEWATIIDDATGEEIELMDYYVQPTRLKGNSTGPGANGGDRPYEQDYLGVFLTYTKRFSNNWDLMASYSYSESHGMNPRFFSGGDGGSQGSTFYSSRTEADPNVFVNAASDQLLAGDRRHILRLMGNVMLPYQFKLNSVINIQSGRMYNRSQWYRIPNHGSGQVITNPGDDSQRFDTQYLWDFGAGKHFRLGKGTEFSIYLMVLNILNDDAVTGWITNTYTDGEELEPGNWVLPRRAELRLRITF